MDVIDEGIRREIRMFALDNAVKHGGKASYKAVVGKILGMHPELKKNVRDLIPIIKEICEEINSLSIEEQKSLLQAMELPKKEKKEEEKTLEDLPNVEGEVRMRLAPSPSGPMHLGQSRMAILNDEYVKRYGGILYLRIEDTNPHNILPEAYDMLVEDCEWLGVDIHRIVIQSERIPLYYDIARKLIEIGKGYVCTCEPEKWRDLKSKGIACEHREDSVENNLERWDRMLEGHYSDGEAVMVVKTDLKHPNPAIRDWIAFRIITDVEHPRTGSRYSVYPLMNMAVAVDDHYLNLTHVLRGKDHLNNTYRQMYIYDYFGWKKPVYIHYGWVMIRDAVLKTSIIKEGIRSGKYRGWDDVRLATIRALAKRGIRPEAIRKYWIKVGLKEVDIEFSWDTLYSYNREIIDPIAKRYFFVWQPMEFVYKGPNISCRAPYHPSRREMGYREYTIKDGDKIYLTRDDVEKVGSNIFRLKDLCNARIEGKEIIYEGNDLKKIKDMGGRIIQWVPPQKLNCRVYMPDGKVMEGFVEKLIENEVDGNTVQFERFGFARIEKSDGKIIGYYAHR